jgi:hypothetical protein
MAGRSFSSGETARGYSRAQSALQGDAQRWPRCDRGHGPAVRDASRFRTGRKTASAPARRGVIPRHHIRRNAPPGTDRNALPGRPRPDRSTTLTARRRPPGPAPRPPPSPAGVLDERCQLPAERRSVLLVQVDLILRATDRKPHRLDCRAAIEIIFQRDSYPRCHLDLHDCGDLPC